VLAGLRAVWGWGGGRPPPPPPKNHPHRTAPPRQFPENHIDSYLSMGGVSQEDLAAVRKRLLG
jgi:hypothetical protein